MLLFDRINSDIKSAMLSKDKVKLAVLRDIKSKLLLESTSSANAEVTNDVVVKVVKKLHKQRLETIDVYTKQGRSDLAEEEELQSKVLEKYLPKQLSVEEIHKAVIDAISETNAQGMQDMGKVMSLLNSKIGGQSDGKVMAAIVKEELA
tara:strand:- start:67 stop:513 length:447 start_codon:yes stop_codon:yes gene_type:complete